LLNEKSFKQVRDRIKIGKELDKIKSDYKNEASIFAKEVSDEINEQQEIFQYSEVNKFLLEKQ
jgi:hypothetical protein